MILFQQIFIPLEQKRDTFTNVSRFDYSLYFEPSRRIDYLNKAMPKNLRDVLPFIYYSYANVSLTVNRDALLAGMALATDARISIKISHAMIPLAP